MPSYTLTVSCISTRGIVSAITSYLAENGCDISDSSQFDDMDSGLFFMRLTFSSQKDVREEGIDAGFSVVADRFEMAYAFHSSDERMKVLLMVSHFGHCLNDLLYRWKIGALLIDIVGVVSNHFDYQKLVVNHDIPFFHIKVTKESKPQAEVRLMEVVEQSGAELIVLARYMQVLSDAVCKKMSGRIINIHHSFLPSFKGASPYKQAFERGVKLIGATAHYVTEDLDEGRSSSKMLRVSRMRSRPTTMSQLAAMLRARFSLALYTRISTTGSSSTVIKPSFSAKPGVIQIRTNG